MTGEGIAVRDCVRAHTTVGLLRDADGLCVPDVRRFKDEEETARLLTKKLMEEVGEFIEAAIQARLHSGMGNYSCPDEFKEAMLEEAADVIQVIRDLTEEYEITWDDIDEVLVRKANKKGPFTKVLYYRRVTETQVKELP